MVTKQSYFLFIWGEILFFFFFVLFRLPCLSRNLIIIKTLRSRDEISSLASLPRKQLMVLVKKNYTVEREREFHKGSTSR